MDVAIAAEDETTTEAIDFEVPVTMEELVFFPLFGRPNRLPPFSGWPNLWRAGKADVADARARKTGKCILEWKECI